MKQWIRLFAAIGLIAAISACAPAAPDTEAEKAALMQASRNWSQAAATGDAEKILAYWADDAIVMPPDEGAVVGKEALREYVRASLAVPGFSISWEPEQASVSAQSDVGYLIEKTQFSFTDANGVLQTQHGKSVTVWRKNADGAWKCVVDTWNNNPPEKTPDDTAPG